MKIAPLEITLRLHLLVTAMASLLSAANAELFAAIFIASVLPFFFLIVLCDEPADLTRFMCGAILFFIPLMVGYVLNPISIEILVRVLVVGLIMGVGWTVAALNFEVAALKGLFWAGLTSGMLAARLLFSESVLAGAESGVRLSGGEGSHPNLIGLTMVCLGLCGLASSAFLVRVGILGLALYGSILVESRNAILTILLVLMLEAWRGLHPLIRLRALTLIVLGISLLAILAQHTIVGMVTDIFLLDDDYRGANSDFVGRAQLWQATWDLFLKYPLFGFGLGQHTIGAKLEMYAHNMYLIILSECGLLGLTSFALASIIAFISIKQKSKIALGSQQRRLCIILYSVLGVYFAYGVFEGRAINAGNFLSYLFFFSVGYGLACACRKRMELRKHGILKTLTY